MMNIVALFLIATSLLSGGFFSPSPEQKNTNTQKKDDIILKEANRIIMVEYERESLPDNNSPPPPKPSPPAPAPESESEPSVLEEKLNLERNLAVGAFDKVKEKGKQAASVLPNLGQGIAGTSPDGHHFNPKELICDAFGKCKQKVAGVFSGVKEKAQNAEEALEKAKDQAYQKVHGVEEEEGEGVLGKTKEAVGKMKDHAGEGVMGKAKEAIEKGKESVYDKAKKMGEAGEMVVEKGKEGLGLNKGKEMGGEESVSDQVEELKDSAKYVGEKTLENVKNLGLDVKKAHHSLWDDRSAKTKATSLFKEAKMNFTYYLNKGSQNFVDAAKYAASKEAVNPVTGVVHLLGLATAYGMSVWVTFVSSHVLAGALPRQQFGLVQSKIYPVYFKALLASIGCSLFAHATRNRLWGLKTIQAYNITASLGFVLLNLLIFEPRATQAMFDKMKLEKEEGRGLERESVTATATPTTTRTKATTTEAEPGTSGARREEEQEEVSARLEVLNKRLKNLNTISSLLNVLTLMSLTWQLVYFGRVLPISA